MTTTFRPTTSAGTLGCRDAAPTPHSAMNAMWPSRIRLYSGYSSTCQFTTETTAIQAASSKKKRTRARGNCG